MSGHQGKIGWWGEFWLWVDTLLHPEILQIAYQIAGSQAAFEALDRQQREVILEQAVKEFRQRQTQEGRT